MTEDSRSARPGDIRWEWAAASPLRDVYLTEVYWLARQVVDGIDSVFAAAPPPPPGQSYFKVDHEVHRTLYSVLAAAVRLKALIEPRPKRRFQTAERYQFQERRIGWLRNDVLAGIDLNEVLQAQVRNSLEHFDEYLDETAIAAASGGLTLPALLPLDMAVGRHDTVAQFAKGATVLSLRVYVAEKRAFVNCGREVDLAKVREECHAIGERVRPLVPSPAADSQGSYIVVLRGSSLAG